MKTLILYIVAAFFIGAIPIGYLLGRLQGKDLRASGSGNIGATNAGRVLGKRFGLLTFIGDVVKGIIAVTLILPDETEPILAPILAVAAVAGHCFSPFLKFRGGKGVATAFGVFLVLAPKSAVATLLVFAGIVLAGGYVSLGSVISAVTLPLFVALGIPEEVSMGVRWAAAAIGAIVLFRHRGNIRRLLSGTESSWTTEKSSSSTTEKSSSSTTESQTAADSSASGTKCESEPLSQSTSTVTPGGSEPSTS